MSRKSQVKNDEFPTYTFLISGTIVSLILGGLFYYSGIEVGFLGAMLFYAYGGGLGILARTKHTSFLKNLAFLSFIGFIIYAFLNPIQKDGGITIIHNSPWIIFAFTMLIFAESEVNNVFRRLTKRKPHFALGIVSSAILLPGLVITLGLYDDFVHLFKSSYKGIIIALLVYWIWLESRILNFFAKFIKIPKRFRLGIISALILIPGITLTFTAHYLIGLFSKWYYGFGLIVLAYITWVYVYLSMESDKISRGAQKLQKRFKKWL